MIILFKLFQNFIEKLYQPCVIQRKNDFLQGFSFWEKETPTHLKKKEKIFELFITQHNSWSVSHSKKKKSKKKKKKPKVRVERQRKKEL